MHFLFESSLGVLPLDPLVFFHYLDPHVCPRIWHIENSRPSLWNPRYSEKGDLPQRFAGTFSCYAIFKWIWTYKTHDLTDYQLNIGSFLPAITFMWSDRQIPRWPQFFQQPLFPSVPSLVDFNRAIISRLGSFHIDFLCAHLATPVLSYRFFQIFVAPVVWSILEIAVLRPPWFVSIVQSFFKASSSCPNPATPIARDHLTDSICVFPAGGSWRAVGVGRLPNRVLDVSTRRACLHGVAQFPTFPDLDVLDRGHEDPDDEADALAARRPVLMRTTSPSTSISIHGEPAPIWYVPCVSWPGLFRTPHCHTSPPAQDATKSQVANVSTRNSSLCWQFGVHWRNPRTETFLASEGGPRTSGDIS